MLFRSDISRYVGRPIAVSPDMAGRRFSGVLAAGKGTDLVGELADLMGLETKPDGKGLRLVADDGKPDGR